MTIAWAMALALLSPRVRAAAVGEVEPNLQLRLAVEYGDLSDAKAALAAGANVNAPVPGTSLNPTPLHQAVSKGNLEIARWLLEQGANPYLEDDNHNPVLVYAHHSEKSRAMLRLLLDWKVPIDSRNSDGDTALSRCLPWPDNAGFVALLLESGSNPNFRLAGGTTPLMSAAKSSKAEMVALLIKSGADVNAQDEAGDTPLRQCGDLACLKLLLAAGAKINLANKAGETPLLGMLGSADGADLLLIERGADLNVVTKEGNTLLMEAAWRGKTDIVRLLLARKVNVQARDRFGRTAVHQAASAAPYYTEPQEMAAARAAPRAIMELLAGAGADLKAVDAEGRSALHFAVGSGYIETVRWLLEKKLDPSQAAKDGRTPLHRAIEADVSFPGVRQDVNEKVRLLLASGAAPDVPDKEGRAPLYLAIQSMNRDFALRLIGKGASVDRLAKDGLTPLLLAARSAHDHFVSPEDYAAIVTALAAQTTAPDPRDALGRTPLMWAAASDVPAAVEALLAQKADLHARSKDGRTALMWAASANAAKTIKILLEKGADKSAKDNAGRTASAWARWMGQSRALDLLGDAAP